MSAAAQSYTLTAVAYERAFFCSFLHPKPMFVMQVIMTRLGRTQASAATLPELAMQKVTQACLLACACLHSAQPKAVCHCDVRFANVLWGPEPFLADLEFAHFSPWQVMMVTFRLCWCKQLTRFICCASMHFGCCPGQAGFLFERLG